MKSQPTGAFYTLLTAVVSSAVQLSLTTGVLFPERSFKVELLLSLTECLLIYLPFIFLHPIRRWMILIPSVLISLWTACTIPYSRAFSHVIPLSSFFSASSYNSFVVTGGVSLLGTAGWLSVCLSLAAPIVFILKSRGETISFSRGFKLWWSLLVFCVLSGALIWRASIYSGRRNPVAALCIYLDSGDLSNRNHWYVSYGFIASFVDEFLRLPVFEKELSALERIQLQDVIRDKRRERMECARLHPSPMSPSVKNVIVILVESGVNTFLQDTWRGPQPMPFLKALSNAPEAATFRNVSVQAAGGRSSDGQLIYMSGLLPIRGDAWANICDGTIVPSLLRAQNFSSCEIVGESPSTWNHSSTTLALGFDKMRGNLLNRRGDVPIERWDSEILSQLLAEAKRQRPLAPYFLSAATLTMHGPYSGEITPLREDSIFKGLPSADYNYILKSRYFDRALRLFIEELKKTGAYDNALIVIASDHDPFEGCLSVADSRKVFVMLLNSGYSGVYDREVAQLDIYPTLLRLTGNAGYVWPGFGTDLFHPASNAYVGTQRIIPDSLFVLSERVLRSRTPLTQ